MTLTYDVRYDVAYIRFRAKTAAVETVPVSDDANVDLAPDGAVYGIELLNASEQLKGADSGLLVLVNEALGEQRELAFD